MEEKISPNKLHISMQEIKAMLSCPANTRYQYTIKRIADTETMWTLGMKDGSFAIQQNEEKHLLPLWSSKEFAEIFGSKYLDDYVCIPISLDVFEESTIDFICEGGYSINVFPTQNEILGNVVDITTFAEDLSKALEDYN